MRTSLVACAASFWACGNMSGSVDAWSSPSSPRVAAHRFGGGSPFRSARRPLSVRSNEEFRVRFVEAEVDPSHGRRGTAAKHSHSCDVSMPPRRRRWWGRRVHDTQRLGSGMLSVRQKCQRLFLRAAIAFMAMFISLSSSAGAAPTAATPRPPSMVRPLGTLRVLPTKAEIDICLRLVVASLGGAAVGLERSSSDRPAGVRTMALVSLGAAAFTICSMYGFLSVASDVVGARVDPSRMASNIVSGVGFIGAGVITNNRQSSGVYDRHSSVNGLTTAAAIWVSAAVGVACGVGMYVVGASAAASTIAILRFGRVKNTDLGKRVMKRTKRNSTSNTSLSTNTVSGIAEQAESTDETLSLQMDENPPVMIAGDGLASRSKLGREDVRPHGKSAVKNDAPSKSEWIIETETPSKRLNAAVTDISTPPSIQGADADPAIISTSSKKGTRKKTAKLKTKDGENGNNGTKSTRKLVDPLLEMYLWGDTNDGLSIPPNNSQSFELAKPPPQRIEEGQEIVVRSSSSGNDGEGGSK